MSLEEIQPARFERECRKILEAHPVILIEGKDVFLRRAGAEDLRQEAVARGLEIHRCGVRREEILAARQEVACPDLFGANFCIMVSAEESPKKESLVALDALVVALNAGDRLIVNVPSMDKRGRSKRWNGVRVSFKPIYPEKIPGWAMQRAGRFGLRLPRDAALLLAQIAGGDLARVDSELEKLGIYLGEGAQVETEDVKALCGGSQVQDGYELSSAFLKGSPGEILRIRRILTEAGANEVFLNIVLAGQLHRILGAVQLRAQGLGKSEIAQRLGMHPFFAARLLDACKDFSMDRLQVAFQRLLESDYCLKQQSALIQTGQDAMLVSLCNP